MRWSLNEREEVKEFSQADAIFAMEVFDSLPNSPLMDGEVTKTPNFG
jgi:hypothetical protein